jgi:hypothetical protein
LLILLIAGCGKQQDVETGNAVYYWRTEWRLDSIEQHFLESHDIQRVYCRYFDVVMNDGQPMPNATITFADTIPAGIRIIPTVYITEDCMHQPHQQLAEKIVERVAQMNETNDIAGIKELQIDCDYTHNSRKTYYEFLAAVRQEAARQGWSLSTTIRLHQLSMAVPPVDYGVLMLYNTGSPMNFQERNPVLDFRDVQPYLRRLEDYSLPLAAAYPVYRWQRNIYGVRIEHQVEASEILQVKQAVEHYRPDLSRNIVTYHLDKDNINRYDNETFKAIYHH